MADKNVFGDTASAVAAVAALFAAYQSWKSYELGKDIEEKNLLLGAEIQIFYRSGYRDSMSRAKDLLEPGALRFKLAFTIMKFMIKKEITLQKV